MKIVPVTGVSNVIFDRFYGNRNDSSFVYVVAVPSADYSVKSVRVFSDKDTAIDHVNKLYETGVYADMFESKIE